MNATLAYVFGLTDRPNISDNTKGAATMSTAEQASTAFEGWAMLELMGHRTRVGFVREVELAGTKMLRIDIPTEGGDVTEFYSGSSVYSLRPLSEEVARDAAKGYGDPRPVRPVEYREPAYLIERAADPRADNDCEFTV